ncbi:MAG: zinc ribbon domain-containing protein [Treponema sp.]|nr:zinc ribbon domain-containing protein [Treponema sp.]
MANCTNCGKPLKEGMKFCTSCGTAVKGGAPAKAAAAKVEAPAKETPAKAAAAAKSAAAAKPAAPAKSETAAVDVVTYAASDAVVSTAGWFGTIIVLMVPIVGLVLYFVWAFGSGNLNRRNYCRASLIMMAISIVLTIITLAMSYSAISSYINIFM